VFFASLLVLQLVKFAFGPVFGFAFAMGGLTVAVFAAWEAGR
jgi:hypothetical protein